MSRFAAQPRIPGCWGCRAWRACAPPGVSACPPHRSTTWSACDPSPSGRPRSASPCRPAHGSAPTPRSSTPQRRPCGRCRPGWRDPGHPASGRHGRDLGPDLQLPAPGRPRQRPAGHAGQADRRGRQLGAGRGHHRGWSRPPDRPCHQPLLCAADEHPGAGRGPAPAAPATLRHPRPLPAAGTATPGRCLGEAAVRGGRGGKAARGAVPCPLLAAAGLLGPNGPGGDGRPLAAGDAVADQPGRDGVRRVLTLLADIVSTGAVATTLPSRAICSPLDLKVQFVRPVWPDGRALRATATVAHRGRRFRDRPRRDRRCGRQDGGAGHVVDGGRRGAVVGVAGRCRPSTQRSLAQTELEERRDEMNVLIVTFPLEGMPEAVYSRACQELAPRFAAVPGLISKVWLADPATKTHGGVYSFRDHPALEAYLASELFASLAGLPGLGEVTVHAYGVLEGPTAVTWRASNAAA